MNLNFKSLFQNRKQRILVVLILGLILLSVVVVLIDPKLLEQGATEDKKHVFESQLLDLGQSLDESRIEWEKTDTLEEFYLIQEEFLKKWLQKSEVLKKSLAAEELDTILYTTLFTALDKYRKLLEMGKELELHMEQTEMEVYLYLSQGVITSIEYNQGLEAFLNEYHHETNIENMEATFLDLQPISEEDKKVHQLFEAVFLKMLEYEKYKVAMHSEFTMNGLKLEGFEEGCRVYLINIFSENND